MRAAQFYGIFLLLWISACGQQKQNNESLDETSHSYGYELVVPDVNVPWAMAFLPDGNMLITERSGKLILFNPEASGNKKEEIENLPEIYVRGQGGLMDIELHPDYEENGWIYLTYASEAGEGNGGNTALMRAKLENGSLVEKKVLYKAVPNTTAGQHFGSRIEFDEDGFLYFSIGERGEREVNPQDITRDGGKIYRLNDDGSIPQANPFVNNAQAKKAIFSYGHRNPQGMKRHPATGEIWVHEHGPKGGDEINIIQKGGNYGWPIITDGDNYSGTEINYPGAEPNMIEPVHYWTPSIAPSGMLFVTSEKYPHLQGNLLVGSLKFQYLELDVLENQKVVKRQKLLKDIGRVRSIAQGPDGFIYIGVESLGIVRLVKK